MTHHYNKEKDSFDISWEGWLMFLISSIAIIFFFFSPIVFKKFGIAITDEIARNTNIVLYTFVGINIYIIVGKSIFLKIINGVLKKFNIPLNGNENKKK